MVHWYYQSMISHMRFSVPYVFGVVDEKGEVVACTMETQLGSIRSIENDENEFVKEGSYYYLFNSVSLQQYYAFIDGKGSDVSGETALLAGSLAAMDALHNEEDLTSQVLRSIASGEMERSDIYGELSRVHIANPVKRYAAVLDEEKGNKAVLYNVIDTECHDKRDYLFMSEDNDLVLLHECRRNIDTAADKKELEEKLTKVQVQFHVALKAGFSDPFEDLCDLSRALHQGKMALEAGKASLSEPVCTSYDNMGLGALVASLPAEAADHFVKEILEDRQEIFDEEMMYTVTTFLENDLNISETSKKLFINRNTLIYRLNKIEKETGYDLKKLDDAIAVRIAMMVRQYREGGH